MIDILVGVFIIWFGSTSFGGSVSLASGFSFWEGFKVANIVLILLISVCMTSLYGLYFIFKGVGL